MNEEPVTKPTTTETPLLCTLCHYQLSPAFYFCPNCGTKIITLSTSTEEQIKLYLFSILLPMIGFIFITRWHGMRYIRSGDPKKKMVGTIALTLMIITTVALIWYTVIVTNRAINAATNDLNELMNGLN